MTDLNKWARWYQLSQSQYLGPVRFRSLIERYSSDIDGIFGLSEEQLLSTPGITRQVLGGIRAQEGKSDEALRFMEQQRERMATCAGGIVTLDSPDYPALLKNSAMCHPILYYRGDLARFRGYAKALAIVGSREATEESQKIAFETAHALSHRGWVITSGLAKGIDAAAHRGALAASGLTIAVVGCGPDILFPSGSEQLNGEIADKGLIVSEFPFGEKVGDWKLKKRNKTIVGLALGAFVVQTRKTGGTMNAVTGCREQNKPIFTIVPHENDEYFSGNAEILLGLEGIGIAPEAAANTIAEMLGGVR